MKDINDRRRSWQDVEDEEQAKFLAEWQRKHPDGDNWVAWAIIIVLAIASLSLIGWGGITGGWLPPMG